MIQIDPRLPVDLQHDPKYKQLYVRLYELFRDIAVAHNNLAGGYLVGQDNRATSAPTTGSWSIGDYIRNSSPSEAGTAGSKYLVLGWCCTAAGTPGTWKQCRVLTGN